MKIPNDWNMAKFGELAKITCGVAATPEYVDAAIGVPFLSARNVQKERLDLSYFQHIPRELHEKLTKNTKPAKGDVLLTRVGAGIGEAAVVDIDFEFSVYVSLTLIKCGKNLDSEYVKSLLNTNYYRYLATRDQFAGGGVQNLNVQMVKEYPIPVPPLPEQKKIAQILSTWDKAITTTEQLLANSQQQKKALMQQLLTGKKRLLDNNGVRFSGEWKWLKVSDLLKVRKEKQVPTKDVPLFSLTIEDGITPKSDRYNREFLVKNTDEKKYKLVKPKDIVYNPANLRWGAINFSRMDHSVVVSPIYEVLFLKDKNKTSLEFIAKKLMTPDQIGRFAAMVEGTLVERMAVKIEPFLATKLSVPPTLEEQQKIAAVLSTADQEVSALQQKLDALKQEKKALMQQLLTGKRRVTLN